MFRWRQRTLANTNSHTELYPDLAPEPTPLPRLKSTAMGVSTPSRLSMSRYTRTSGTSSLVFDFFLLYCHILLKCVLQKTSVYDLVVECSTVSEPEVVSTTSVVVSPIDVNDNPPQFAQKHYSVNVSESLQNGQALPGLLMSVSDSDGVSFLNLTRLHYSYRQLSISLT